MVASDAASASSSSSVRPSVSFGCVRSPWTAGARQKDATTLLRKPFFGRCVWRSSSERSRSKPRAGLALPRLPQVLRSVSRRPGLDWVVV